MFAEPTAEVGTNVDTTGENSSTAPNPDGDKATATTETIYGKQDTEQNTVNSEVPARKSFKEVIKEYGDEATDYLNKSISKRLNKYKNIEAENSRMREILQMQSERYGLDVESDTFLDDFANKVQNDTKLYEEEALQSGLPVEDYIKVKNAERIIAQNKRNEENRQQEQAINAHIQNLIEQSEKLKTEFNNFDLEAEIQNPTFKRLVDPPEMGGIGMSVKDAFYAVHYKEIMQANTQNIVNQVAVNTAQAVATNKARPSENGLSKKSAVVVKDDPSKFTLEDFKKIKEQMYRTGVAPRF